MKDKDQQNTSARTSRRQFTKAIASTVVAAPLVSSLAQAQTPKPKEAIAPPNPQASPTPQKPSPVAEAYAEVARARFGDYIKPEQWEQVKKDLAGNVRSADRLRNVKLKNEDEPDFVFSAG